MIVEFIGMPASGKTTLANRLFAQGALRDVPIKYPLKTLYESPWAVRNLKKSLYAARYVMTHMPNAARILRIIVRSKQGGMKDVAKLFFNNLFFLSQRSSAADGAICIFDEGAFHYAWALLARAKNLPNVEEILTMYPMPDALIAVETPPDELRRRYEKRKSRGKATERHEQIMRDVEQLSARIGELTVYASQKHIPVLTLQNDAERCEDDNERALISFVGGIIKEDLK